MLGIMAKRMRMKTDQDREILAAHKDARDYAYYVSMGRPITREQNDLIKAVNAKLSEAAQLTTVEIKERITGKKCIWLESDDTTEA